MGGSNLTAGLHTRVKPVLGGRLRTITVQAYPRFRNVLLKEGIETMLSGNVDTGKAILRDYINATVGFEPFGANTGSSPKSLIRMFGPSGNPQARNLFTVISHLQRHTRLTLHVTAHPQ